MHLGRKWDVILCVTVWTPSDGAQGHGKPDTPPFLPLNLAADSHGCQLAALGMISGLAWHECMTSGLWAAWFAAGYFSPTLPVTSEFYHPTFMPSLFNTSLPNRSD